MAQVIVVPFDGQEIGQGFNSETRESIGTGLVFDAVSEDPAADGQNVSTQFESISTQDNLMEALGMSTSVDARYALFSGGAKVSFAESHAVNSFSSYIAGRCQVQNAIRHGHGFRLTPMHKPWWSPEGWMNSRPPLETCSSDRSRREVSFTSLRALPQSARTISKP